MIRKINRCLRTLGQKLKTKRIGSRSHAELGRYYIVDVSEDFLVWNM